MISSVHLANRQFQDAVLKREMPCESIRQNFSADLRVLHVTTGGAQICAWADQLQNELPKLGRPTKSTENKNEAGQGG